MIPRLTGFTILAAGILAFTTTGLLPAADDPGKSSADNITPIATNFEKTVASIKIDGKEYDVTVQFANQGNTVFILPVWTIAGKVQRLTGEDRVECKPTEALLPKDQAGESILELNVIDLMQTPQYAELIREQLKKYIAGNKGKSVELEFRIPQIKERSHRVSLTAEGGSADLPDELPVSDEVNLPSRGEVSLLLNREAIRTWEKAKRKTLALAAVNLQVTASMKVKFEKLQFVGKITLLENSIDALHKQVSSSAPSGSPPEVFVELPHGGDVAANSSIASHLRQSLRVTIETAKDASATQIFDLLQSSLNGLIKQQSLKAMDEGKRVAILLDNQVTVSATVGQIHSLANMTAKEREMKLKEAHDDFDARRAGRSSSYSGEVSLGWSGFGGKVGGGTFHGSVDETEQRRQSELEALQRGFDQLQKHFSGSLPTLTGISFDQKDLQKSMSQIDQEFKATTFETGYSLHSWPPVALRGSVDLSITPAMLFDQYASLKSDYDAVRKLIGTPEQLVQLRADIAQFKKSAAEVEKQRAAFADALAQLEKKADSMLAKVDQASVAELRRDIQALRVELTQRQEVEVEIADKMKMVFCWVPAGEAQLGSPKEEQDYVVKTFYDGKRPDWMDAESEGTRGIFKTKGFWMAKYPVTQEQWEAVMGKNPSYFLPEKETMKAAGTTSTKLFPVEQVSWKDCQEFIGKLNEKVKTLGALGKGTFALPHEDQWEYACRGGKGNKRAFYFGNALDGSQANCDASKPYGPAKAGAYLQRTTEVGSYENVAPHPWGLCDMCGNVWQWCENTYNNQNNSRVLRGGSWYDISRNARSAYRDFNAPDFRYNYIGFRVVLLP